MSKRKKTINSESREWVKTKTPRLFIRSKSGRYYARYRVDGKIKTRSLDTTVYTTAQLRLADLWSEDRDESSKRKLSKGTLLTFEEAADIYLLRLNADSSTKPATKRDRQFTHKRLLETWPGLNERHLDSITKDECIRWAANLAEKYAPITVVNTVDVLRLILEIAVEDEVIVSNPANAIKKPRVIQKVPQLPDRNQFRDFVEKIRFAGSRHSRNCGDLVEFLAYTGLRISEAGAVCWKHVDFNAGTIRVTGPPGAGTKTGPERTIPILENCEKLLRRIEKRQGSVKPNKPVMAIAECQRSMDRAAKLVGMPRITHHDLRHMFATRAIEAGVDIPTVSRWLGHKDGGALAMRVYGHLRDDHSREAAKKVKF